MCATIRSASGSATEIGVRSIGPCASSRARACASFSSDFWPNPESARSLCSASTRRRSSIDCTPSSARSRLSALGPSPWIRSSSTTLRGCFCAEALQLLDLPFFQAARGSSRRCSCRSPRSAAARAPSAVRDRSPAPRSPAPRSRRRAPGTTGGPPPRASSARRARAACRARPACCRPCGGFNANRGPRWRLSSGRRQAGDVTSLLGGRAALAAPAGRRLRRRAGPPPSRAPSGWRRGRRPSSRPPSCRRRGPPAARRGAPGSPAPASRASSVKSPRVQARWSAQMRVTLRLPARPLGGGVEEGAAAEGG